MQNKRLETWLCRWFNLNSAIFWYVSPCDPVTFRRNVGEFLPDYTASHFSYLRNYHCENLNSNMSELVRHYPEDSCVTGRNIICMLDIDRNVRAIF
jgi:hypothetical protein